MFEPKPIRIEAVPAALEKALRYRLLNEPVEAESICRDVLAVDPENQEALVTLLLALTDQFDDQFAKALVSAKLVLPRLDGEYERAYYEGIIYERWAKAQLDRGLPADAASNWLREAMRCFEEAEQLSGPDEPDAILRWNACVRELERQSPTAPDEYRLAYDVEAGFGDDTQAL
jgi:tetratricopeptide (TPR) repeat protein